VQNVCVISSSNKYSNISTGSAVASTGDFEKSATN
jgi:hypothetical protein